MKVSFFHLMPYQHLPQGFESKHHSAWVDLPNENFDPELGQHHYTDYLDELQFADKVGFDGVCVNEHHNNAYGIMPFAQPHCVGAFPVHLPSGPGGAGQTAWPCTSLLCGWRKRWPCWT